METESLTVLSHLHDLQLSETLTGCFGRSIKWCGLHQIYTNLIKAEQNLW